MKKYIPAIIASLLSIVTLIGCGGRGTNTATRTEDPSLDFHRWQDTAKIVKLGDSKDTVFLGLYLGMPEKDARKHLQRMIRTKKLDISNDIFTYGHVYYSIYFGNNKEAVFRVGLEFEQDSLYLVCLKETQDSKTKKGDRIEGIELSDSLVSKFGKLFTSKGYSSYYNRGFSTYYYRWDSNTSIELHNNTIEFKDLFLENNLMKYEKAQQEAEKRAKEASYNNAMNDSKGDF